MVCSLRIQELFVSVPDQSTSPERGAVSLHENAAQSRPADERLPILRTRTQIEIPMRTVARIILTLALIWLVGQLFSVILTFVIALMLTAALAPAVNWLEHRGVKRMLAVAITMLIMLAGIALLVFLLLQPVIDEGRQFADDFPSYVDKVSSRFDTSVPDLYDRIQETAKRLQANDLVGPLANIIAVGRSLFTGASNALLVLVMTAYLLSDGRRIYLWAVRYLPDDQEEKVRRALPEISHVVSGYVVGQLATSILFGLFSFGVLKAVGVPQALFLALIAALLDAVPIIGALIATVPAVLLALTVSPTAALIVLIAYLAYQQLENYIIVPRVYRGTLQISSFAVLIAVLIGSELLGILGALLALPVAAAFPVVERIWITEPRNARRQQSSPAGFIPVNDSSEPPPA
jgi:predicted PurR-regulated permease PerM